MRSAKNSFFSSFMRGARLPLLTGNQPLVTVFSVAILTQSLILAVAILTVAILTQSLILAVAILTVAILRQSLFLQSLF